MEIRFADTFWKSFKRNVIDVDMPWTLSFWRDKWYHLKRSLWALRKYFRITTKMVPWDYSSVLEMMKFQIGILADYLDTKGIEVDEGRLPKIQKMRRFVELAEHKLEDDYAERCGFDHDYEFVFEPVEGNPNLSKLETNETPEQEANNIKALKESHKLEEKEWNEMIDLLKDMRSWWD